MGIRQLYPHFKKNENDGPVLPGQLFWVPTPQIDFFVVETKRAEVLAHTNVSFSLASYDSKKHYREKTHLPVKLLQIDQYSEALLYKSKKRPCVVLGSASVPMADCDASSSPRQTKQLTSETFLVAPAYSANSAADPTGPFPPDFLERIAKLHYPQFSWIPPLDGQGPGSVLRLDRIMAVSEKFLTHEARCGFKLNSDAFHLLQVQMSNILQLPVESDSIDLFNRVADLVNMEMDEE